ncbi:hypothetical protein QC823_15245 [Halomonas vilamensis]|uniref:Uncharacterized protein n=1 Tax=Vreelandella vilamensis TaxID=531309 RepID=A0ABU1H7P2_9GAMM|nr:hypothetical protein [Halomonas vilamensis]MDR5900323.1 hypothetical protein [Halomonas vilamensis]
MHDSHLQHDPLHNADYDTLNETDMVAIRQSLGGFAWEPTDMLTDTDHLWR